MTAAQRPPPKRGAATAGDPGARAPRSRPLRVILADDEVLLRAGMARLLTDAGIEVVAELGDPAEIVEAVRRHEPDVAIVDVETAPGDAEDGLGAAIEVRGLAIGTAVLVLTNALEDRYPLELIGEDGCGVGYLLKHRIADVDAFVEAIRRVAVGGSALDPEVVARMVGRRRRERPIDGLTPRERAVLGLMAEGRSNHGISSALEVTPAAVEKHITAVFAKLGLVDEPFGHRRVMAVLELLRAS